MVDSQSSSPIDRYGTLPDGTVVKRFTLRNAHGMQASIIEYGAILSSLSVPTIADERAELTLGYDSLEGWCNDTEFMGAIVGRFANRIAQGRFVLDGKEHLLATNDAPSNQPCHLHGGARGFNKVVWRGELVQRPGATGVTLTYVSADGEEGYPGEMTARATYWLTDDNELCWEVAATTTRTTVVNLAQHAYWNLSGDPAMSIEKHWLTLNAAHYLPVGMDMIPTGEVSSVANTPMDFRQPQRIGARIDEAFEQLKFGNGYDHAWVLKSQQDTQQRHAATLMDPVSGRAMQLYTNQPAVQFYSGNSLHGRQPGRHGVSYGKRSGLCLETQAFPNAPNVAHFPSAVLYPNDVYRHRMTIRFSYCTAERG